MKNLNKYLLPWKFENDRWERKFLMSTGIIAIYKFHNNWYNYIFGWNDDLEALKKDVDEYLVNWYEYILMTEEMVILI
jgi:hypothetical protein